MEFQFDLARAGTNWMHSHLGLQEQPPVAAPLIVRDDAGGNRQEVVLLLHDFTFTPPEGILEPLAVRSADRSVISRLTGGMAGYCWAIDDRTFDARVPIEVAQGERVEITLVNETVMSHPMHLHGHHFQVVGIGKARLSGAMRDTVLVPPMERVTIASDADSPGDWPLHCHNLYHMAVSMMTTVRYL